MKCNQLPYGGYDSASRLLSKTTMPVSTIKLTLPAFLATLTSNNIPVQKAMAMAGKL